MSTRQISALLPPQPNMQPPSQNVPCRLKNIYLNSHFSQGTFSIKGIKWSIRGGRISEIWWLTHSIVIFVHQGGRECNEPRIDPNMISFVPCFFSRFPPFNLAIIADFRNDFTIQIDDNTPCVPPHSEDWLDFTELIYQISSYIHMLFESH